jgi:hypothetical protein
MNESQPDIEIYLKKVALEDILSWLASYFDDIQPPTPVGVTLQIELTYLKKPLSCIIVVQAAKGGYTSVCFEPNQTPWSTDEQCAQVAFDHFQAEVRCTIGGWTTDSPDTEGWYRFTESGQSVVNWLT